MSFAQRRADIREGFGPSFWVANFTEIFERVAYYATMAVFSIYLYEQIHLSSELTGQIFGAFGLAVYLLPVLGGTLADRFGFRRSLMFAFLVMTVGYFLLGSISAPWMHPLRQAMGDKWLILSILLVPALGPALVKPCVAGTIARDSTESVRSLGYSIYYTIVNVGGFIGPLLAWFVRKKLDLGFENVFRVAAACVFAMFWVTLFFFREPPSSGEARVSSVKEAIKNMLVVLGNFRFVAFLLITSGFYVIFWQEFISLTIFIRTYVDAKADVDLMLSIEPATVVLLQIAAAYATRKIPAVQAIALGFLISGLSWIFLAIHPSVAAMAATLFVLALGEITQSSRYYEYCSRLAPPNQQGLYMGFAFLPIAIGNLIAGVLGGYLLHTYGEVKHRPQQMWWVIAGIGVLTAVLMWAYDRIVQPAQAPEVASP